MEMTVVPERLLSLADRRARWSPALGSSVAPAWSGMKLVQLSFTASSQPPTVLLPQIRSYLIPVSQLV